MKLIYIIFIFIGVIVPFKGYAIDITAGVTAWYAWGSKQEYTKWNSIRGNNSCVYDPTFLYGPVIAVRLNDYFNLTFVYLYSKFSYKENVYKDIEDKFFVDSKVKRSDSDLALNYRLNNSFRVFAGAKYLSYEISSSFDDIYDGHCYSSSKHKSIGPGLGVSGTYPVTDNIFLLATLSGFYLFSTGEKFEDYGVYDDKYIDGPVNMTVGYNEYGINTNISAAYYITGFSTTINLGFRFQYFITDYSGYKYSYIDRIKNMFYGITLSATYTLGFD